MSDLCRLVIASGNQGKIREIEQLLQPLAIEIIPQTELGVASTEEPFLTFVENALAKARHAAAETGLPALADDSGICVKALNGAPGVHSARYAGEPASDARNNGFLLKNLDGVADRRAHYVCVIVCVRHASDPQPMIAQGEWHGEILASPRGTNGFGYDPLFLDTRMGMTSGELSASRKNRISHRGKALRRMYRNLQQLPG